MRDRNVVLLFVINCNYGTNFVDTSTHTQIINVEGLARTVLCAICVRELINCQSMNYMLYTSDNWRVVGC
jgi:hypothetical protein